MQGEFKHQQGKPSAPRAKRIGKVQFVTAAGSSRVAACTRKELPERYRERATIFNRSFYAQVVGTASGEGPASYDKPSKIPKSALLGYGDVGHGAHFQHSSCGDVVISDFLDSCFPVEGAFGLLSLFM